MSSTNIDSLPNSMPKSMIERRIEELKAVPARDPLQAASGRARFLREAAEYRQALSPGRYARQSGWIFLLRKEKLAVTALVWFLLAFVLLLGGGVTIAAAQDDLPDQSLYQLKLWTEDARLVMTADPQGRAERLMTMAQTRVEEMAALAEMGVNPPDRVRERLEKHLQQTLMLAAGMDEAGLERTLLQLRDRLQKQDRLMQKLQDHASAGIGLLLNRTRQTLQSHLQLAEQGLADPQGFRTTMRNRMQNAPGPNQPEKSGTHQNGPTGQPTGIPGDGNGKNNCKGNGSPCDPNPEKPKGGNGNHDPGKKEHGGPHPEGPQNGNGSGGDNNNGGGNGSGGGGGDK